MIVSIFALAVFLYSFFYIRKTVISYAKNQAETVCYNIANGVIADEITNEKLSYNEIVALSVNNDNNISSLKIDVEKLNFLKSKISSEMSEKLSNGDEFKISIPLGTLFGNEYTLGFGPDVEFKMKMAATAVTDFKSNFYSAGINQVLHQIVITVNISGELILPYQRAGFTAKTSVIAAQTVLVGVTPDAYTNVQEVYSGEENGVVGAIFDYGAEISQ